MKRNPRNCAFEQEIRRRAVRDIKDIPRTCGAGSAPIHNSECNVGSRADILKRADPGQIEPRQRSTAAACGTVGDRGDVIEASRANLVLEQATIRAGAGATVIEFRDRGAGNGVARVRGHSERDELAGGDGRGR